MLAALATPINALADIYCYKDKAGHTHYTDRQKHAGYKVIIKTAPKVTPYTKETETLDVKNDRGNHFSGIIAGAAKKYQVDEQLLHAVIQTESAYNANALSPKGAVGLMQLMPETARRFGVTDRRNPDQNIDGGTHYLKHLIALFAPDISLAVAAYNAGENAVIRHNNEIPPYPETQHYVRQVLALYRR